MASLAKIFQRSIDEKVSRRWLAVPVILLLSAALGWLASERMIAAVAGLASVVFLILNVEQGLVLMCIAALAVPVAIQTGTKSDISLSLIVLPVLIVGWVLHMLRQRSVRLSPSRVNLPLMLFALAATFSFLAGSLPGNQAPASAPIDAQLGGWGIVILACAIFLLAGNQINQVKWLKSLVAVYLAVGAVAVGGRIVPPFGEVANSLIPQVVQGSSLFWLWIAALSGGQALFNKSLQFYLRLALGGLALLAVAVMYLNSDQWLSGWLPASVVVLGLLALRSWRIALLALGLLAMVLIGFNTSLLGSLVSENQYSIDTRVAAMQVLLGQVLPANPIIGLGFANYYHYAALYPILGWYVKFNSHNNYIDIVMQMGIVGLILFAWLAASIGRLGLHLRDKVGSGFERGYVYACLAGFAGMLFAGMLGDWFLPFVYNIGLSGSRVSILGWMFLGGLIAIERLATRQPATPVVD